MGRRISYFILFAVFGLIGGLLMAPLHLWWAVKDWAQDNWRYAGMAATETGPFAYPDRDARKE